MSTSLDLLVSFSKVGTVAWGGGPAMVPLMEAEFVQHREWMSQSDFLDMLSAGYALPGPLATKVAIWVGWEQGGVLGVVASLAGMVLPSALMVGLVLAAFTNFKDHPRVVGMMRAVHPVVLALLVFMLVQLTPRSLTSWHAGVLGAAALVLLLLKVHPLWLLLGAAGLGALVYAPS